MNQIEQSSNPYGTESEATEKRREDRGEALRARDIMTRQVITVSPSHSLTEAISLMAKHSFRHFVVVDGSGDLIGVVSDRDILRALARKTDWERTTVSEFMSDGVFTVNPATDLSLVTGKMLSKRIHCLPVVDDHNQICGIVTSTDLLNTYRWIQERFEKDADSSESPPK